MAGQLDLTLDTLEEVSFRNRVEEWMRKYKWHKTTHFNNKELCSILYMYHKLQRENVDTSAPISRFQFRTIFHTVFGMPDSDLMTRIFYVLIGSTANTVHVTAWVKTMNIFLRGTLDEKIEFCFEVYDGQRRGELRRDQMMYLLRKTIFKHEEEDVEEAVKELVDLVLQKMDVDHDGKISKDDFVKAVHADPDMLECFGQCLPDRAHVHAFLMSFTDRANKF